MPLRNGEYQNLYTPLSQNMTDSDNSSEEELHSTIINASKTPSNGINNSNGRKPSASAASNAATVTGTKITARRTSLMSPTGATSTSSAAAAQHQQMLESLHRGQSDGSDLSSTHFIHHSHDQSHLAGGSGVDHVAILGRSSRPGSGASSAGRKLHDQFAADGARPPMSPRRRCLFVASIVLCVLTVVVFVWVVPCSVDGGGGGTCPARAERPRTQNWMRHYEGLELKGAINVVRGVRGRSNNLVFMYRGERLMRGDRREAPKRNGIIALVGSTGAVSWYDEMANEPSVIDCSLIDADRNGVKDCLVLDEYGELGCIDPVSGTWLWHNAARTVSSAGLLSFPLVLPDMSDDGVEELLLVTSSKGGTPSSNREHSTLMIVSGATGRGIGAKFVVRDCSYVHKFQLDAALKLTYNCIKSNGTEFQVAQSLDDLHQLMTNRMAVYGTAAATGKLPTPPTQHKFYGQRRDTLTQRNIYAVAGRQLIVENAGKCPDACNVTVQLVEQRDGKEHVLQHFNGSRMYGMVPALLSFNATGGRGGQKATQAVHGFVIKFWQWADNETDVQMQFGGAPAKRTKRERRDVEHGEYNRFEHVLPASRPLWRYPDAMPVRLRRSPLHGSRTADGNASATPTPTASPFGAHDDEGVVRSKMRVIRERVVLIVFNSTDTRIENTSQSNIVQFCRHDDAAAAAAGDNERTAAERPAVSCQPDLNYQENSVLIADLDGDGSQELVTYYTTYVNGAGDVEAKMEWKLMNYVQLLRLEAELPKLYVVEDGGRV